MKYKYQVLKYTKTNKLNHLVFEWNNVNWFEYIIKKLRGYKHRKILNYGLQK